MQTSASTVSSAPVARRTVSGRSRPTGGGAGGGKPIASQFGLRAGAEVRERVEQRPGEAAQGRDPGERLRARLAEAVDDGLARLLRRGGRHPVLGQRVEESAQTRDLHVVEPGLQQRDLDPLRHAQVRGGAEPEAAALLVAGRRLERGDERVAERRERRPLRVAEQLAGREGGERLGDRLRDLRAVGEVMRIPRRRVARVDHQRLALRVLADPVRAVARAQPGGLPAAHRQLEGRVVQLRVVDDRGPGLDPARDPLAALVVAGPHGGLEAVRALVGERDRLLGVADAHHRQRRAKRLLDHAAHRVVDAVEHRRPVEAPRAGCALAAGDHAGALLDRVAHVRLDQLDLRREDDRPDVDRAGLARAAPAAGPRPSASAARGTRRARAPRRRCARPRCRPGRSC